MIEFYDDVISQIDRLTGMIKDFDNHIDDFDRVMTEMSVRDIEKTIEFLDTIYMGLGKREAPKELIAERDKLLIKINMILIDAKHNQSEDVKSETIADIPEAKRDLSRLDEWVKIEYKNKDRSNDKSILDRLKLDIETFVSSYDKSDITALAQLTYEYLLQKSVKPSCFKGWMVVFCDIIGTKAPTLKQSQVIERYEKLKKTYYYLITS